VSIVSVIEQDVMDTYHDLFIFVCEEPFCPRAQEASESE